MEARRDHPNASSVDSNTQVPLGHKFWLFLGLVSFLCALGIFTESQFYAYTIGIHGTDAHIIYYVVGVTLSSAIQVLLIQPDHCKTFLKAYAESFFIKSCGDYLFMFTICFLSSGTGLPYLGPSSDRTSPSPVVAVAPYRSQAFSEFAGLLASALLTVNALSIIMVLELEEDNAFFEVAAALTMESAIALLYKHPHVTVAAAVFILAMTLLKVILCRQVVKKTPAAGPPADGAAVGEPPAPADELPAAELPAAELPAAEPPAGKPPADEPPAGKPPADELPAGKPPADELPAGQPPAGEPPAGEPPADEPPAAETPAAEPPAAEPPADGEAVGEPPAPADELPADELPAAELPAGKPPADEPPADEPPAGKPPADELPAGKPPAGKPPADERPAGQPPADELPAGEPPAGELPAGEPPADGEAAGKPPADGEAAGKQPADGEAAGKQPADDKAGLI